ncbi:MAG TPA: BrnT family toxin [Chitinolyticbacter sp.]|nr:BrnT family toxin [Chitinolyticbacter sp.]
MDLHFKLNGEDFVWNADKADLNLRKHGIRFEEAATVFADPLFPLVDASRNDEARAAVIGLSAAGRLLFVVTSKSRMPTSASSSAARNNR